MKKQTRNQILMLLAAIIAVGIAVVVGGRIHDANAASPPPPSSDPYSLSDQYLKVKLDAVEKAGIVEATVEPQDVPMTLTLTGRSSLNMDTVTHVRAQFGGKVVNIGPQLGAHVEGPSSPNGATVLCVIESNDLAQAKAGYIQAKIQARQDEDTYNRTKELVQAKVLAEKFLIDALSTLVKDRAALEATRQQLLIFGLTQTDIDQVQNEVGRQRMDYVITSPRTGVIAEKGVSGGEIADPSLNLFTIADTNSMWVWGDVYERDLKRIKVGQSMKIYFTSEPDVARECKIDWISPVLDPNTHSVKIRGLLDNTNGSILSDMYGTMIVTVDDGKNSIIVPSDAVVREGDKTYVFLRAGADSANVSYRRVLVKLLPIGVGFGASEIASAAAGAAAANFDRASSSLRVTDGLKAGDVIVIAGALGLFNEMEQQSKGQ